MRQIQRRLSSIASETDRLSKEVAQIEGPEAARRRAVIMDRKAAYTAFFAALNEEAMVLGQLYEPVHSLLSASTNEQEQALGFSIRWHADIDSWLQAGASLMDQRKRIPYGSSDGMEQVAKKLLIPAWTSGKAEAVVSALDQFLSVFGDAEAARQYLRSTITYTDLLLWAYSTEYVSLSYGLKYRGVDLENLSPGTKGIVLLILYLGMDQADSRPLIVDQPDENLDNESIYALLTKYFKDAKKRRQIILITHNPNLVVNSDSEQVIIATNDLRPNGLPRITYRSGSLKNPSIRKEVCRILEGGEDAFIRRERRYALKN